MKISGGGRYVYLFISLLLLFFFHPFVAEDLSGFRVLDIIFLVILLSGIYSISSNRQLFAAALLFSLVAFGSSIGSYFLRNTSLTVLSLCFYGLFFGLMMISILSNIMKVKKVTADTIFGSICVYLLLGTLWAIVFGLIEISTPGSFNLGDDSALVFNYKFIYYSFVTLTTLGYGDITPVLPAARTLSSLEAVTGQLYIAILVARLVALHIMHEMHETEKK